MFSSFDTLAGIERVEITEISLAKMGLLETPSIRPWEMNTTGIGLQKLMELENANGSVSKGILTGGILSGVSSDIINIGNPIKEATIAHGWGTTRMVFTIKVAMYYNTGGNPDVYSLRGYTDYFEMSSGKHIDPDIRFYINSIAKEHSSVLNSVIATDIPTLDVFSKSANETGSLLRPTDIFTGIQVGNLVEGGVLGNATTIQVGSSITSTPKMSSNENLSPGKYIAKLLNSYIKAEPYSYDNGGSNTGSVLEGAIGLAREDIYSTNPFLSVLSDVVSSGETSSIFKLRDIHKLDNTIESRIRFSPDDPIKYESDTLGSLSAESTAASAIASILYSVMGTLELNSINFMAHNRISSNTLNFADQSGSILEIHSATSSDPLVDIERVKKTAHIMLSSELLNYISKNGMFDYVMSVDAVLGFTVNVQISLNGGNTYPYSIPWAMNNMFVPVIGNQDNVSELSFNTSSLLEQVTQ